MARNPRKLQYTDWRATKTRLKAIARQTKGAEEARKLPKDFEEYDPEPGINPTRKVGLLKWETHAAGPLVRGFTDGRIVATIRKLENNRHVNCEVEVYEVTVLGQSLPDRIHHIEDARKHGSRLYAEPLGETE